VAAPVVVLYADCFTTYNDSHIGRAAIEVLERLGYRVRVPRVGCCGRAMISTGLMDEAIASADRTLEALREYEHAAAIVVCEPSCLSAIKDDWMQLKLRTPLDVRRRIADKAMLVEDFVGKNWDRHPKQPVVRDVGKIVLHGHCHQKALWGDATSGDALKRVGDVTTIPSGCCGMAGSFGYQQSKYDLSMKIGELSVFPPIRAAGDDAIIAAPGTSCRHQIRDGTGREAVHPIEVIAAAMAIKL
jgi:Fe-S oxidoreductase